MKLVFIFLSQDIAKQVGENPCIPEAEYPGTPLMTGIGALTQPF